MEASRAGGVGDEGRPLHQGISRSGVDELSEFLQHLGHLISALAAADIDDDIRVGPLGDGVLGHGFPCSEASGHGGGSPLGDGEHGVQDTLPCDQGLGGRIALQGGAGNPDGPFLAQSQLLGGAVGHLQHHQGVLDGVISVGHHLAHPAAQVGGHHGLVQNGGGLLGFGDDGASGDLIPLGDGDVDGPQLLRIQGIHADSPGNEGSRPGGDLA